MIGALEDAEDYRAFETAVIADYDAQSAVERELVLRLGSLLWQIRRATTMETGLFEIQAKNLFEYRKSRDAQQSLIYRLFGPTYPNPGGVESDSEHRSQAAISAPKAERLLPGPGAMPLGRPDSFRWRNAGLLGWSASKRSKPAEARGQFRIFNKAAKGFEHDPTVFV